MRARVRTAGQVASLLGALRPGTPVACFASDTDGRELEGNFLVVETATHDSGWQYARVTVELPPTALGRPSDCPLLAAEERRRGTGA